MTPSISYRIGDCLQLLHDVPDASVDLVCTDPPYGYSFMGKDWDRAVPSTDVWRECLRILKPGSFAFVMSAPRQDVLSRMIVNISDAGFDTAFTSLYWTYATGFAKAMNISKAVDKKLGAERMIISSRVHHNIKSGNLVGHENKKTVYNYTVPATPQAKALDGAYAGFQPKPAVEVIIVAMRPLAERNYVEQALANGKGCTWLDDCRIPYKSEDDVPEDRTGEPRGGAAGLGIRMKGTPNNPPSGVGRFPANLLVSDDVLDDGKEHSGTGGLKPQKPSEEWTPFHEEENRPYFNYGDSGGFSRYFDLDAWFEQRLKELPEEVRKTFPFLICPKPDQEEKSRGLNKRKCVHPTVKPLALMSWLITLGSREGDLVLDPYLGSGTTLLACRLMMRSGLGFELQQEYEPIIKARLGSVPKPLEAF